MSALHGDEGREYISIIAKEELLPKWNIRGEEIVRFGRSMDIYDGGDFISVCRMK